MPDARRWKKRQKVLADFGELALCSDELDAVLAEVCRLVAEALGTGHAKVLEFEEERQTLFVRAGFGWDKGIVGRVRLSMSERSSETFSIEAGKPVITNDIASETRFEFPAFIKEAGVKAIANVPIFCQAASLSACCRSMPPNLVPSMTTTRSSCEPTR